LIRRQDRVIYEVSISVPGDAPEHVAKFETTEDHPWRTADGRWIATSELQPDTQLVRETGTPARVVAVRPAGRSDLTYNLEVAEFNTYFVGIDRVWVHNACLPIFSGLRDHARRHSNLSPNAYHRAAAAHLETGTKFRYYHDNQFKNAFITRIGGDLFTYTAATINGRRIFTHMEVDSQYLRNLGITLPAGF
jgi:hypothetical protein